MKKTDIHVLNWDKITKNTTKESKTTVNKGILFEDLIEKLLAAMFPDEIWRRTLESHDGKRDFVYPSDTSLPDQKWDECKNYNNNLSLNIIAPTLIMGTIEKIESIFFFSYSPLNNSAVEGILRYSETFKKNIRLYDGNVLESLICKYHNINGIADFFPDTDFEKAYLSLRNRKVRIIKIFKDMNGNKLSPLHLFELGESFHINIIIQNLTHESKKNTVFSKKSQKNLLIYDEFKSYYTLPFSEIEEYSIQCQTLKPGNANCRIKITTSDMKNPIQINAKLKIIDEPYLFWTGEHALKALSQCENHLLNFSQIPLLIVAESGMGKTTLIHLLTQEKSIYKKYKLLKMDLNLTRNCCIKSLFSLLVELDGNEITPEDQKSDDHKAFSFFIGNYAESAEMISETIMKFYDNSHPYLFIIDDIQKIDRSYITLFRELNEKSRKENKPIYYIAALNESDCSIESLFSRLNLDSKKANDICDIIHLKKFNKNDIISFLKHKLGLQNIDKYFVNFNNSIRPLEMHHFCSNLKSEKIIRPVPSSNIYQIIDPFKFEEQIRYIYCANISLTDICASLKKGDIPEYLLKCLYLTDTINSKLRNIYADIIYELIDFGILKEVDGQIVFYHDEIRNQVEKKLVFSEEDFADIYADNNIDKISKALCALHEIGVIRNSISFLKEFFKSNLEITKKNQRFEICWLIFKNLNQLIKYDLNQDALYFVQKNFTLLNSEQGHLDFLRFLKHIADSALINSWDTDNQSVEIMAYFIKKFFDRSLSTYNYQDCLEYFKKYEKIFHNIIHITDNRRYFWLSHYANRAAIALDRTSIPLLKEPDDVSKMYQQSQYYYSKTNSNKELLLQITVDNFNRYYIYRHNLTFEYIKNTHHNLIKFKQSGSEESVFLDYHLLLLKYLEIKMSNVAQNKVDYLNLKKEVINTRQKSYSPFYTLKLYMLEIYILIDLNNYSNADIILEQAFKFVYKRGMRSYIYKLTYIKAHLLMLQNKSNKKGVKNPQIFLAFEQLIQQHQNTPNDLMREIFLLVRLVSLIEKQGFSCIQMLPYLTNNTVQMLIKEICKHIKGEYVEYKDQFNMSSYFVFDNISFPNI